MAHIVINERINDFVYIQMHAKTNRKPSPMSQLSMRRQSSKRVFFKPMSIATTETNSLERDLKKKKEKTQIKKPKIGIKFEKLANLTLF